MTTHYTHPHTLPESVERELDVLRRMVSASHGTFSLSIAVCSSGALREQLIAQLLQECPNIRVLQVQSPDVFESARAAVGGADAAALFVVDLEALVPSDRGEQPVLRTLNASRELWNKAMPLPVVFWVPEYLATLLSIHARDFWAWRSHQFEFELPDSAAGAKEIRSEGRPLSLSSLTAQQKRTRIAELERRIAEAGSPPSPELRQHVMYWLADLASLRYFLGDPRHAVVPWEQALTIAREIGDRRGEGVALGNLGLAYAALGEARRAIEFYEQRLTIAREIGDRRGEGNALGNLGNAYAALGEMRRAIEYYEQQLVIAREIGDRRGEGNALGNLGTAYARLGEVRRAIEFYEQTLTTAREIGDRRGEANASWNLGDEYAKRGDLARAIQLVQVLVDFERQIGHADADKHAAQVAELRASLERSGPDREERAS